MLENEENRLPPGALVLMLLLSACGGDEPPQATRRRGSASRTRRTPQGGELSFALATSPDTLDPHRGGLAVSVRVIRTIHDSLVVQAA